MSSHFNNTAGTEARTRFSYLISRRRPPTVGEQRFISHAYWRMGVAFFFSLYFVYCNPEYSYSYAAIRKHYGWDENTQPLFPQFLKLQKKTTTPETMSESMSGSYNK